MDAFTENLCALILERERVDRRGQDLLIETLDLTKAWREEIEAANAKYCQGLLALGSRLAAPATRRPPVDDAASLWFAQAAAQV